MNTVEVAATPRHRLRVSAFIVFSLSVVPLQASSANIALSLPLQITHAQNYDPSPLPDGKRLVYLSQIAGKEQVFTMDSMVPTSCRLRVMTWTTKILRGHTTERESRLSKCQRLDRASRRSMSMETTLIS